MHRRSMMGGPVSHGARPGLTRKHFVSGRRHRSVQTKRFQESNTSYD